MQISFAVYPVLCTFSSMQCPLCVHRLIEFKLNFLCDSLAKQMGEKFTDLIAGITVHCLLLLLFVVVFIVVCCLLCHETGNKQTTTCKICRKETMASATILRLQANHLRRRNVAACPLWGTRRVVSERHKPHKQVSTNVFTFFQKGANGSF